MTTRETIEHYFERLGNKDGWEGSFADDMVFVSDVAEIFTVNQGKIDSIGIYFDSAPYSK